MQNFPDFLTKHSHWLLLVLLEVVSFVLLCRFNNYQGSVFLTSANWIPGVIYEGASNVSSYFGLRLANRALTSREAELELQVSSLRQALREFQKDTTAIAQLQGSVLKDYQIREAQVVNNSVTRTDNYITINKGSQDGITPEMGVISGLGIVGIVYMTSSHYALVLPVLNSKSSISCKIQRTDYFGSLIWERGSSRYAWIKDMPRHSEFSLGDTLVTSGYSSVFPEGIPVGTVDDMEDSHDGLSYRLKVRLFTDFARLSDVVVIQTRSGNSEQESLEANVESRE